MRIAVLTDIHGNLGAFEAVLADLRRRSPDLVVVGGDLCDGGSSPKAVWDLVADQGWPLVLGNGEEALVVDGAFQSFAAKRGVPADVISTVADQLSWTQSHLTGPILERFAPLPMTWEEAGVGVVHAGCGDVWNAPAKDATSDDLIRAFGCLESPVIVHGHTHLPFVRSVGGGTVVNAGSVGMPFDGDTRASYALVTDGQAEIVRVKYDLEEEVDRLITSGFPHGAWVGDVLRTAGWVAFS